MKKIQLVPVWHRKMALALHNCTRCHGWWKAQQAFCTCTKEFNDYDLITAQQCLSLADHNDLSRWFAISSTPPLWCPSFNFMRGVAKEYITKLGCEKYFCRVTYWLCDLAEWNWMKKNCNIPVLLRAMFLAQQNCTVWISW